VRPTAAVREWQFGVNTGYAAAIVRAINSCRMRVFVLSKSAIEYPRSTRSRTPTLLPAPGGR
jgi:hypothetical protein